jgi:hypothetical protein
MRAVFAVVLSVVFMTGCPSAPPRPDNPNIDLGLSLSAPGLNVPPPGNPVDLTSTTNGALKSVTLLARTETSVKVRFKCADDTEHDVDVPIGGGYVDTGCTSSGKKVRVNVMQ